MSTIKTNTIQPTAAGNNLIFANGSAAEKMRITDAGLVGIGTASPLAPLHVSGLGAEIRITTPGIVGADWAIFPQTLPGSLGTPLFRIFDRYNYLDRLTISSDGLVGIGTSAPTVALDVAGAISTSGNLKLTGGASTSLSVAYTSDNNNRALLGWNTLQLGNNGLNRIVAGNTNIAGYLEFWVNNTTDLTTHETVSNGIRAMTIASTGKVGIGTTTPTVALDVAGSIKASTSLILGNANATMAAPNGSAPIFGARAWAYIPKSTVSGTQPASSGNIASITRFVVSGVEKLTKVTFITPMPHANYAVVGMARLADGFANQPMVLISPGYVSGTAIQPNTTTEMYYTVWDNSTDSVGYNQRSDVSLVIYC